MASHASFDRRPSLTAQREQKQSFLSADFFGTLPARLSHSLKKNPV